VTQCHTFSNILKDKIMQEATIVSWLSQMNVPQDSFRFVVAKILECARDMVGTHKNQRFFPFESILSLQGLVKMKVTKMTLMGRTLRFLCLLTISQAHSKIFDTTNLKTS
jgi:hypothetical protein